MNYKIVAALRTKNESWIVDKTLKSLSHFCDTAVVYDDQSSDNTEEICRSYDFVDWRVAPPRDPYVWCAGQQATDLLRFAESHDPDYIFMLDADEIPTPSVVGFFDSINEDINLWRTRMVNLENNSHYRIDSYTTRFGVNINWDPFAKNSWKKHTIMKYNKGFQYTYEPLKVGLGSFGPFHPAPNNVPNPHMQTEDFYILHYGRTSPRYRSGQKQQFLAKNDEITGVGTYEDRLTHHMGCSGLGDDTPPTLIKCKEEWFWK